MVKARKTQTIMEDLTNVEWINSRSRFEVKPKLVPMVDKLVTEAVGFPVYVHDPRLIRTIAKWKQEKGESDAMDGYLTDAKKVRELKDVLSRPMR